MINDNNNNFNMSATMRTTLQTVPESLPADHVTNATGTTVATPTATTETKQHLHTNAATLKTRLDTRSSSTKVIFLIHSISFFIIHYFTYSRIHFYLFILYFFFGNKKVKCKSIASSFLYFSNGINYEFYCSKQISIKSFMYYIELTLPQRNKFTYWSLRFQVIKLIILTTILPVHKDLFYIRSLVS